MEKNLYARKFEISCENGIMQAFLMLFMEREIIDYDMYGDPIYAEEPTESKTVDAFGNELESGDTVQLIKELPVKGTKITLKKWTQVKNIRLTDDIEEITANIPEIKGLVLRAEFVKKVNK